MPPCKGKKKANSDSTQVSHKLVTTILKKNYVVSLNHFYRQRDSDCLSLREVIMRRSVEPSCDVSAAAIKAGTGEGS